MPQRVKMALAENPRCLSGRTLETLVEIPGELGPDCGFEVVHHVLASCVPCIMGRCRVHFGQDMKSDNSFTHAHRYEQFTAT